PKAVAAVLVANVTVPLWMAIPPDRPELSPLSVSVFDPPVLVIPPDPVIGALTVMLLVVKKYPRLPAKSRALLPVNVAAPVARIMPDVTVTGAFSVVVNAAVRMAFTVIGELT